MRWIARLLALLIRAGNDAVRRVLDHFHGNPGFGDAVITLREAAATYTGPPWTYVGVDERGVYVRRGDHPPVLLPYGALMAVCDGLAHDLDKFKGEHRDQARKAFTDARDLLEIQAYMWT